MLPFEDQLAGLIEAIRQQLGIELASNGNAGLPHQPKAHRVFKISAGEITADRRHQIRQLAESRGIQITRQPCEVIPPRKTEYFYFGPMVLVKPDWVYHVTSRQRHRLIKTDGLLPSNEERQVSKSRQDCEGNAYVCAKPGAPDDANAPHGDSAHWWLGEKVRRGEILESDAVILEIDISKAPNVTLFKDDHWSATGIVVRGVVPPEAIQLFYQAL